jgi:hypothetical protein
VSCKARRKAKQNRERRERQRERDAWLQANAGRGEFLAMKAAINRVRLPKGPSGNSPDEPVTVVVVNADCLRANPYRLDAALIAPSSARPADGRAKTGAERKRGPRYDPARPLLDYWVASAVADARDAGQSYEEAIAAGVAALRRCGSGASSPKTVEAIVTRHRKLMARDPADIERAKTKLREYGLDI